jgi:hypothetical protein
MEEAILSNLEIFCDLPVILNESVLTGHRNGLSPEYSLDLT